jgi:predicted dehydrogenase
MGSHHARVYAGYPLTSLEAVVDVNTGRAEELANSFKARGFDSVEAMLREAEVDLVSVCTDDGCHVEPAAACLSAGKHVLLEKPIATTLEDADGIIDAGRKSEGKLMVGHIVRFEPRYQYVKERVDAGDLGEISSVYARRLNHRGAQERLGGRVSVLSFLGIHDLDYILWLAREGPVRLYTESTQRIMRRDGYDTEDQTFTVIRFADDMIACVEAGWILPNKHPRRADFKLEVLGSEGMAQIDLFSRDIVVGTRSGWQVPSIGDMLEREISHFVDCVLTDRNPLVSGEQAREALRLSLAAQESARTGCVVKLT